MLRVQIYLQDHLTSFRMILPDFLLLIFTGARRIPAAAAEPVVRFFLISSWNAIDAFCIMHKNNR